MHLNEAIKNKILLLDGALGTMVQQANLTENDYRGESFQSHPVNLKGITEILNITRPEIIERLHLQYLEAGADIITTNSFNANYYGLESYGLGDKVYELNHAAAAIAQQSVNKFTKLHHAQAAYVAGTLGPTKKAASISPDINSPAQRDVTFQQLVAIYKEQAQGLIDGGVDLLLIETVIDTLNAKAALFAINELKHNYNKDLPVMVSGSIDESGHNISGQTVEAFFNALQPFGLFSIGLNCSFGADKMLRYLERLAVKSTISVSAHPNAGLPDEFGNYSQSTLKMAEQLEDYMEKGLVNIIGGCCGTTPEHIKAVAKVAGQYNPRVIMPHSRTTRLSGLQSLGVKDHTRTIMVSERTTVSGSKQFKRAIQSENYKEALAIARRQIDAGAQMINISLDDGMIDTVNTMPHFIRLLNTEPHIASVPFMIDSSDFNVLEKALLNIQGKSIVNSVSLKDGEDVFREKVNKLRRYGANIVAMAFDEKGQAEGFSRKTEVCRRIYTIWSDEMKLPPEDLILDPNVLTIGTGIDEHNHFGKDYLQAVQWIKQNLPYSKVIGGITNVSYAFRGNNYIRDVINSVFLHHAQLAGLDFAIVNPAKIITLEQIPARLLKTVEDLIFYKRKDAPERMLEITHKFTRKTAGVQPEEKWREQPVRKRVMHAIKHGIDTYIREDIEKLIKKSDNPLDIIDGPLLSALNDVGELFERGKMYLPQIIKSARVMNTAVDDLKPYLEKSRIYGAADIVRKKVLLATVSGDVHDIGKNILSLVLQSNNFTVDDMGVMVEQDDILARVKETQPDIIALSGLITPSLAQMTEVIKVFEDEGINIPVMVGGATTSALHTAVRMAPHYSGCVIQCNDASKSASCALQLVGDNAASFIEEVQESQKRTRENYLRKASRKHQISLSDAWKKRFHFDWHKQKPVKPKMLGTKVFEDFDLRLLRKYIDWSPFFHGWGLKGVFPSIFDKPKVGGEAKRVFDEAQEMLEEIVNEKLIQPKGIIGLYPANSDKDDIVVYEDDAREKIAMRIPMLRQQSLKDKDGRALSLSDYVAPAATGVDDYFGGFAVTTGIGAEKLVERFKQKGDSYNSIMFRLIADRLVEAFAEVLHKWVRKRYWGYESGEDLSKEELIKEKYQGIRPAPGYPACPDHSLKSYLFELMNVEEQIGITLTDSYAMHPASSVTGFYMAHNASRYFGIGKIGQDQLENYAKRANIKIRDAENLLSSVIDYDTKTSR